MVTQGIEQLPRGLYTPAQVRALDARAMELMGVDGYSLMERAGATAFDLLTSRWPTARRLAVVAGPGNNGGDAYVVARLARRNGLRVTLYAACAPDQLQGAAAEAARVYRAEEGEVRAWTDEIAETDLIVDGLLGTGLDRPVEGVYAELIHAMDASAAPVFALDVPSGLAADSGAVLGHAVRAEATLSFIALKRGLLTGAGPEHCGQLHSADLGIPAATYQSEEPVALRGDRGELAALPPRARDAHKGDAGHLLIVGGDHDLGGAVRLAGEAALRSGAGLVSLATRGEHRNDTLERRPELMLRDCAGGEELAAPLARCRVVAVGPGLGTGDWGRELFAAVSAAELPTVVDADALNLLAAAPRRRDDWILTPHPGEAARLLGCGTDAIAVDRYAAVEALRARYCGVVVLKGAGSLVQGPSGCWVCPYGNPGMATAGMGDVLTGVIAALWAQLGEPELAARLGVLVHALAGDAAAQAGERGLVASDLFGPIRSLVNPPQAPGGAR